MAAKPIKLGRVWWTHYPVVVDGQRKKKWHRLDVDKETAFRKYADLEERLRAQKFDRAPRLDSYAWDEFLAQCLSDAKIHLSKSHFGHYEATLKSYAAFSRPFSLKDFTLESAKSFIKRRREEGIKLKNDKIKYRKDATINHDIAILKAVGNYAKRQKMVPYNPLELLQKKKLPKLLPRFFNEQEMKKLFDACYDDPFDIIMLKIAYYTGMRQGEIVNLRWAHIDFKTKIIRISQELGWTTKDYEERNIPMVEDLVEALLKWRKLAPEGPFALSRFGTQERADYLGFRMETLRKRAKVVGNFHRLRHTFGNRLARKNVSLGKIKDTMGHADIKTTARYAMSELESTRKDMEKNL